MNAKNRILVAMSGGVDSSASALLLKEQGWEVVGATMLLHEDYDPQDAQNVAEKLGIEFHVIDLRREFREIIIDQFARKYERGLTPNPCVDCNREIKFGLLWEKAQELNCSAMATGHYARIEKRGNGATLVKAAFASKDQSYFLHVIPKELLSHIYFPLGDICDKEKTREIAAQAGLKVASKSDSQDICFVPDGDYLKVINSIKQEKMISDVQDADLCDKQGCFIDKNGNILGHHEGHIKYTIGQRRGLRVASADGRLYVLDKDPVSDTVVLGKNEDLFKRELIASDVNWLVWDQLPNEFRCSARIRYRHNEQPCKVRIMNAGNKLKSNFGSLSGSDNQSFINKHGFVSVVFDEPQRAITPGQFIVFYDGDRVLGGGCII